MNRRLRLMGLMTGSALAAVLAAGCAENGSLFESKLDEVHATVVERALTAARQAREAGDLDTAAARLAYLASFAPNDAEVLAEYGKVLTEMGKPDDALIYYRKALALNADDWRIYNAEAVAYDEKHDFAAAQADYAKALKLAPGETAVLNNAARSRMMAGDLKGAEAYVAQAAPTATRDTYLGDTQAQLSALEVKSGSSAPVAALTPDMAVPAPTMPANVAASAAPRTIDAAGAPSAPVASAHAEPAVQAPAPSAPAAAPTVAVDVQPAKPVKAELASAPSAPTPASAPVVAPSQEASAAPVTPMAAPTPTPAPVPSVAVAPSPEIAKSAPVQPAPATEVAHHELSAPTPAAPAPVATPSPAASAPVATASASAPAAAMAAPTPVVASVKTAPDVAVAPPSAVPPASAPVVAVPAAVPAPQPAPAPSAPPVPEPAPVLTEAAATSTPAPQPVAVRSSAADVLHPDVTTSASLLTGAHPVVRGENVFIRVGTFRSHAHARRVVSRLKHEARKAQRNQRDVHIARVLRHGRKYFRVWIGGVSDRPEALDMLAEVHALGFHHARIIVQLERARHLAESLPTVVARREP